MSNFLAFVTPGKPLCSLKKFQPVWSSRLSSYIANINIYTIAKSFIKLILKTTFNCAQLKQVFGGFETRLKFIKFGLRSINLYFQWFNVKEIWIHGIERKKVMVGGVGP